MTFEKVLEVFNDYLNKDSVLEVVNTKREQQLTHNRRSLTETEILDIQNRCEQLYDLCGE